MLVYTTLGLIERDRLTVKDVVTEQDNARVIATEWFLDDQQVRRDCWVSILRAQAVFGEQAQV